MRYYAIKLLWVGARVDGDEGSREPGGVIASVKARDLSQAIAIAMRRYPGTIAVHGELHATVPDVSPTEP